MQKSMMRVIAGFYPWYRKQGTLSVHSIDCGSREAYYWLAILLAFAPGTSVGNLLAERFSLGYYPALSIFSGLIGVICVAYHGFKINAVLAFWLTYILTRPLVGSLGGFLIQDANRGPGFDIVTVNPAFPAVIVTGVTYPVLQEKANTRVADEIASSSKNPLWLDPGHPLPIIGSGDRRFGYHEREVGSVASGLRHAVK